MEKLGIYNPYSGITTNQSEGFNAVLKHLQHWKEAPIDAIILSLYHLQNFYYNELQRGFSGLGTFSLDERYLALTRPHDEILTNVVHPPEEIVKRIREKIVNDDTSWEQTEENDVDSASHNGSIPHEDKELCDVSDEGQTTQELHDTTQRARARYVCYMYYIQWLFNSSTFHSTRAMFFCLSSL